MAKQKTLKVLKKEIKQINFHLPEKDFRALQKKANLYTNKNMSAWLRYAGLHHKPKQSEYR